MPKQYWQTKRPNTMVTKAKVRRSAADSDAEWHPAQPPETTDIDVLREAAAHCTACPLYKNATQTVFGKGSDHIDGAVFVGEQPGDSEDKLGEPFIGPAGKLLDRAMEEAGIDRSNVYVTNAVKHFKWELRGKRRLHKTPNSRDIAACKPWLEAEITALQPCILVCLGSTAAKAIIGPEARVLRDRGRITASAFCKQTILTVHPSSLLRAPDEAAREAAYTAFLADLKIIAKAMHHS
jgi:DNA polymerase